MAITECDRIPRALRRGPGPMHGGFAPILFVAVRGKPMIHRTAPTGRAWSARRGQRGYQCRRVAGRVERLGYQDRGQPPARPRREGPSFHPPRQSPEGAYGNLFNRVGCAARSGVHES